MSFTRSSSFWIAVLSLLAGATRAEAKNDVEVLQSFGRIPLTFEENTGQGPADTKFIARGPGYTLFLSASGAAFELKSGKTQAASFQMGWTRSGVAQSNIVGRNQVQTTSNYFVGRDPKLWKTGIRNYAEVEYKDVYPGISLVFLRKPA